MPELKFLCLADSHGVAPDALPVGKFDVILHAGDIDGVHTLRQLERMARKGRLPLLYVKGNHDTDDISPESGNDLTGRALRIADKLVIGGIGCPAKVGLMPTDAEIAQACADTTAATKSAIRTGDRLILLSHYPPVIEGSDAYSTSAQGVLSRDVGQVMSETEPLALVHGHVHALQCHQEVWRGTLVVGAGADWGLLTVDVERGHTTYSPWVGA